MDMDGKVLRTVHSDAVNTSGLAFGGGYLWVMSNTSDASSGVHKVDLASGKEIAHLQIPLSPNNISGGIHGAQWHEGKLWIVNNRMRSLIRMNPANWTGEIQIPMNVPEEMTRFHDITFDKDGTILQVVANMSSRHYGESKAGLARYDAGSGKLIEVISFVDGSCDPHGLEMRNGTLISCDAGFHPGWPIDNSPSSGYIFRIDLQDRGRPRAAPTKRRQGIRQRAHLTVLTMAAAVLAAGAGGASAQMAAAPQKPLRRAAGRRFRSRAGPRRAAHGLSRPS